MPDRREPRNLRCCTTLVNAAAPRLQGTPYSPALDRCTPRYRLAPPRSPPPARPPPDVDGRSHSLEPVPAPARSGGARTAVQRLGATVAGGRGWHGAAAARTESLRGRLGAPESARADRRVAAGRRQSRAPDRAGGAARS